MIVVVLPIAAFIAIVMSILKLGSDADDAAGRD